ncbi:hypothetical protein XAC2852_420001 [Xanthomonas citri pv. citri]|uniref:Uncharacterized protein n=1 Tax=Xanthomonas citri pv. citri TaxID=611301 RepID=A0A0U5FDB7_XANCI|nr:hypothetical protein XAC9322_390001 [Xanthomonas citri pv. citri]CEE38718.1 hypothetical protein XAC902_510001 [Xanthomonas citri pv. citri]CEE39285.1 hypothetical protein XAC2911_370001 [Xanthomonas citri pv. citri]CEE59662.1 hypothetical protein XAC71A_480001 [Xanthomonas citri pv. citri]CEE69178.1 hypothetical protein XAC2852_420001 [Xanthomonas citri pv. citri]
MDTSESAIFHGLEMSRKSWAYQSPNPADTHAARHGLSSIGPVIGKIGPVVRAMA